MSKEARIALGGLAGIFIWLFVVLPFYYGQHDSAAYKCSTTESENYGFWEKTRCDPIAYFTLWLVGFTGVLAASTIGLWIVTWRIAVSTKKRDETLERAYLWPGFGESYELDGGQRRKWRIRIWNSGKTVGVLREVHWAKVDPEDFGVPGKQINYKVDTNREDVIPPSFGKPDERETNIQFQICKPKVCCGWIVWEDIFGNTQRQGWKHTLNVKPDAAGNFSIPFPDAYSRKYRPWEEEGA
jgi:hypothetical protein